MVWDFWPLILTTKPIPQESFSCAGSYRPCFAGSPGMLMALFSLQLKTSLLPDGDYTREAVGMDNPHTHKANSVPIHFVHLNGSMILLSRLSAGEVTHAQHSLKG